MKRILVTIMNVSMMAVPGFYFYKNSLQHDWEYKMLLITIPVLTIKLITTISGKGAGVFDLFFDEKHTLGKRKKRKENRGYQPVSDPMRSDDGMF